MKIIVWFGCVLGALSASGKVVKSKAGHTALLECGHTFNRTMIWRHNSDLIYNVNGKTGFSRKGPGELVSRSRVKYINKLEISGVKKEDAGKFSCDADDKLTEHTLLVVSVWTSPPHELQVGHEAMLHCEVAGLNPGSTVQWKRPNGSLHEGSQIFKLSSVVPSDSGTWVCMFSHDGSSFQEDLNIKINTPPEIPTSTTERSKEGQNVTSPKCDTHRKSAFEQLSWWVWVAIGVGSLVVVLLMVLVIFLCKRTRRRKQRMKMNMKNGQHLKPKQYCQCNRPTAAPKPQQGRRKEKPSALHVQPLLME